MTDYTRPAPLFLADNPALDFLNSIGAPTGHEFEWIDDGDDLLNWLESTKLVPPETLAHFRGSVASEVLNAVAAEARDLRNWFREFIASHAGKELGFSAFKDLGRLNLLLEKDAVYTQVGIQGPQESTGKGTTNFSDENRALGLKVHRRWDQPADLLLPIAQAMAELICRIDFARVRNCEGPTCTMWFHDVSKNHTRRWCSMEICGNRAKAAAYRAKKKLSRK